MEEKDILQRGRAWRCYCEECGGIRADKWALSRFGQESWHAFECMIVPSDVNNLVEWVLSWKYLSICE
jgi:hypothetical protein